MELNESFLNLLNEYKISEEASRAKKERDRLAIRFRQAIEYSKYGTPLPGSKKAKEQWNCYTNIGEGYINTKGLENNLELFITEVFCTDSPNTTGNINDKNEIYRGSN